MWFEGQDEVIPGFYGGGNPEMDEREVWGVHDRGGSSYNPNKYVTQDGRGGLSGWEVLY